MTRLDLVRSRIIRLRDKHGLTDVALAKAAKLTQSEVSRFTTGRAQLPTLDFLDTLCRVFDLTLADMLTGSDFPAGESLSKAEQAHLIKLRTLDDDERALVEEMAARLQNRHGGAR